MKIMERVRNMVRDWLRIEPAPGRHITIREAASWETNCIRNRIWYRGDSSEIEQLFKALGNDYENCGRFWAASPLGADVRKAHSGLPGIMVDTLAHIVKSDLSDVIFSGETAGDASSAWKDIAKDSAFSDVVGEAVSNTLVIGDGAFKISVDTEVSPYPILEFWPGDKVDFDRRHGRVTGVIFRFPYHVRDDTYELREHYEPGRIWYELFDGDKQVPLERVPELSGYRPASFEPPFMMAVPLMVFRSQKYPGRGRSVFDNKTDAFDAHDEVISQWIDAVRAGRVVKYIPEEMIPRSPENGALLSTAAVNSFGTHFVKVQGSGRENDIPQIDTIQPEIRYEAFVESYQATLNMCLHGIMSPATLGVNVGRMASAEAQREKRR